MIPGLTNKPRLNWLGIIRLGEKRKNAQGVEYPAKLDHFNFVDAPAVRERFGDNARTLSPILLPANPKPNGGGTWDFSSFWQTSRSAYGRGTGLFCRCADGETASRVNKGILDKDIKNRKKGEPADPQGWAYLQEKKLEVEVGEFFDMPCPGIECPYWKAEMCKNLAVLSVILPTVQGFGVWTIRTSSFNSIRNVESFLQNFANALGGTVAGIPLVLNLIPHQGQVEGRAVTVYVLEMVCPWNMQQLAGLRRRALDAGGAVVAGLLPAPAEEVVPDDLYPHAGADLDAAVGGTPEPPVDPNEALREELRALGKSIGYTEGQMENQIRRADPDHLDDLKQELESVLATRTEQNVKHAAAAGWQAAPPAATPAAAARPRQGTLPVREQTEHPEDLVAELPAGDVEPPQPVAMGDDYPLIDF